MSATYIQTVEIAVKRYLRMNGFTMRDMADRLGVSQQAVSYALKNGMGVTTAKRWAETFGFNVEFLTTGQGDLYDGMESAPPRVIPRPPRVPLLPLFTHLNNSSGWSETIDENECEKVFSPVNDVDFALRVCGKSMAPVIPSGALVFVKRVDPTSFIEWGKVYVLDTVNGPLIRYLVPGDSDDSIKCISANHESMYVPVELSRGDIIAFFRVVMCMTMM